MNTEKEYQWLNFPCTNISENRNLINDPEFVNVHRKNHNSYTNARESAAAFRSRANLVNTSKCNSAEVDKNPNCSQVYTKFKQKPKRFRRLIFIRHQPNETWSDNLAEMQQLASQNAGMKQLIVAADGMSRHFWVHPIQNKLQVLQWSPSGYHHGEQGQKSDWNLHSDTSIGKKVGRSDARSGGRGRFR